MIEICFAMIILIPLVYYGIGIHYYLKRKDYRPFLQLIIFPIPIMAFAGVMVYGILEDPDNFDIAIRVFLFATIPIGIGILAHQGYQRDLSRLSLITRTPASIILILSPLFLINPDLLKTYGTISFMLAGTLLGTYGYIIYYKGKKVGLIYGYMAILFFVLAPLVCMAISIAYFELLKDNIIYRRSDWGRVSCHDIGLPIFFFQDELIRPILYAAGYTGIMGVIAAIRKNALEKKVRKDGLIPKEYDQILEGKGDEDG
jgi:hypothetical protein